MLYSCGLLDDWSFVVVLRGDVSSNYLSFQKRKKKHTRGTVEFKLRQIENPRGKIKSRVSLQRSLKAHHVRPTFIHLHFINFFGKKFSLYFKIFHRVSTIAVIPPTPHTSPTDSQTKPANGKSSLATLLKRSATLWETPPVHNITHKII